MSIALMGCARDGVDNQPERQVEFEGRLIELNGQATSDSRVKLTLYQYGSGSHPKRYVIESDCFDAGYFDEARNQYVSGSAPETETSRKDPLPLPHDRFCDPNDLSRQRLLREWMFSGAAISIRPNDGRAVISMQAGATAVFAFRGPDLA